LLTIKFSAAHWGQVNRITYPVLVPEISGFCDCVIDVFVLDFRNCPGHAACRARRTKGVLKEKKKVMSSPGCPGQYGVKTVTVT
jgi:hypothetical protein